MSDSADPGSEKARARPRAPGAWRRWLSGRQGAVWQWSSVAAAVVLYTVAAPVWGAAYGLPVVGALALPAVQFGALVAVRSYPSVSIAVFAVTGVIVALWTGAASAPWPWPVTTLIGYVLLIGGVWVIHGWRRGLAAFLAPGILISLVAANAPTGYATASWIVALSLGAAAAGVCVLVSDRVRIAAQLTRERAATEAETERRLIAEERQRIARELHDVVAHGLSLIQVQATSAPYRVPELDGRATEEFESIARAARESLQEMRRLLSALRGDESAEHAPQPTLEDIPRLVAESERAGATIELEMAEMPTVPTAIEIACFRIVQEAISNAVRHAPGTAIHVAVGLADDALLVEVQNDAGEAGAARDSGSSRSGHGLVGMRERAALLGGSFHAGPTAAGGFRVSASLLRRAAIDDVAGSGEQR